MTPYEGLGLPQLMEKMHDIVMPEPISFMPVTVGWQIVGVWLILLLLIWLASTVKRYIDNRYRREALALLARIDLADARAAYEISTVLKRTALAVFPREEVGSLTGSAWAEFLVAKSGRDSEIHEAASVLAAGPYGRETDCQGLYLAACRWVKIHHA